ncbi:WG repeat-containing protein [Phycisphaeraceae bacterium D3-23]
MTYARPPKQLWLGLVAALLMLVGVPTDAQCTGIPSAPPNTGGGTGNGGERVRPQQGNSSEGLLPVQGNEAMGLINHGGYLAVDRSWDWVDYAYDNLIRAVERGRTGYANAGGGWSINPIFAYADRFENGYAVVGDGEHFGIIDKRGELIVPIRLDGALRFREGYAAVQIGEDVGFIDVRGEVVVPVEYARVRSFHQGYAAFTSHADEGQPATHGYLDKRGNVAWSDSTGRVTELRDFNDDLAAVCIDDKWGYLSRRFRGEIRPQFDGARDFADGLAAVQIGELWGYIDRRGRWVVQPTFEDADDFEEGYAMVKQGGLWGYIDKRGEVTIRPQYTYAEPFFRGYARVTMAPNFGYIGTSGRAIWDPGAAGVRHDDTELSCKPWLSTSEQGLAVADASPIGPYQPEHLYDEGLPAQEAPDTPGPGTTAND